MQREAGFHSCCWCPRGIKRRLASWDSLGFAVELQDIFLQTPPLPMLLFPEALTWPSKSIVVSCETLPSLLCYLLYLKHPSRQDSYVGLLFQDAHMKAFVCSLQKPTCGIHCLWLRWTGSKGGREMHSGAKAQQKLIARTTK